MFHFSQQKIFLFIYFHFALINAYKFLHRGQVFLHTLFAFLFLLQQVKWYLPNKNQLKNYSDSIYLFLNWAEPISYWERSFWELFQILSELLSQLLGAALGTFCHTYTQPVHARLRELHIPVLSSNLKRKCSGMLLPWGRTWEAGESRNSSHKQDSKIVASVQVYRHEGKGGKRANALLCYLCESFITGIVKWENAIISIISSNPKTASDLSQIDHHAGWRPLWF